MSERSYWDAATDEERVGELVGVLMGAATVTPPTQVLQWMWDAGFRYNEGIVVGLAVAYAETAGTLDPKIKNTAGNTPPSIDRGLWEFNSAWHPEVTDDVAYDGALSTKQAFRVSKQGSDWTPWSAYNNGSYKNYLPAAWAAWDGFSRMQALQKTIDGLTANVQSLNTTVAALTHDVQKDDARIASLTSQLSDAIAKITTLTQDDASLQAQLQQALADRQAAQAAADRATGELHTVMMNFDNWTVEQAADLRTKLFGP